MGLVVGFFHRIYGRVVKPIFSQTSVIREWLGKSWNLPFIASGCVADVYACDSPVNEDSVGFLPNLCQIVMHRNRRFAALFHRRHLRPIL